MPSPQTNATPNAYNRMGARLEKWAASANLCSVQDIEKQHVSIVFAFEKAGIEVSVGSLIAQKINAARLSAHTNTVNKIITLLGHSRIALPKDVVENLTALAQSHVFAAARVQKVNESKLWAEKSPVIQKAALLALSR